MSTATQTPSPPRRNIPWRLIGWAIPVALLSLPAILDFPWTLSDFVLMGVLFLVVGLGIELAFRLNSHWAYRLGGCMAVITAFLLVWINLAVGIIGNEGNPLNLMYLGVIAIGLFGSMAAKFKPAGVSAALFAAAVAMAAVGTVALVTAGDQPPGATGLVTLHAVFVMLIAGAASLFKMAASAQAGSVRS